MRTFREDERPEIHYPCSWEWKIVGRDEQRLRQAVSAVLQRTYTLRVSNTSRTGKYVSLELVTTVHGDEERRGIGQALHDHADVLYVF